MSRIESNIKYVDKLGWSLSKDSYSKAVKFVKGLRIPLTNIICEFVYICNLNLNKLKKTQRKELVGLLEEIGDATYVASALHFEFPDFQLSSKNFSIEKIKELALDFQKSDQEKMLSEKKDFQKELALKELQNYIAKLPKEVQQVFANINLEAEYEEDNNFFNLLYKFHNLITKRMGISLIDLNSKTKRFPESFYKYFMLESVEKLYKESFKSIFSLLSELNLDEISDEQLNYLYYILKDNNHYQFEHISQLNNYMLHRKLFYLKEIHAAKEEKNKERLFNTFIQYFFGPLYYSNTIMSDINQLYMYKNISRLNLSAEEKELIMEFQKFSNISNVSIETLSDFIEKNMQRFPNGYPINNLYEKIRSLVEIEYHEYLQTPFDIKDQRVNVSYQKYEDSDIPIYQLSGVPFHLLVHVISSSPSHIEKIQSLTKSLVTDPSNWLTQKGLDYISTSLINDEYIYASVPSMSEYVIYGFNNFEKGSLLATYGGDAKTSHDPDKKGKEVITLNSFDSPNFLTSSLYGDSFSSYNEVVLRRNRQKPDYILCYDGVNETAVKHANFWKVPIIIIDKKSYEKTFEEKYSLAITEFIKEPSNKNLDKLFRYNNILINRANIEKPTLIYSDCFSDIMLRYKSEELLGKIQMFLIEYLKNIDNMLKIYEESNSIAEIKKIQDNLLKRIINNNTNDISMLNSIEQKGTRKGK